MVLREEPRPAYDRVHLTSYFAGRTPDDLSLVDPDFMARHGIELHLGDPATAVDRTARTVTARSGLTVRYDALVLATGSYPFVPPVPGKDSAGCYVYRTLEDLLAIAEYAHDARTGVVVGGGLLGLEAAGALQRLGLDTHIVEFAPRLMALQVDEGGGAGAAPYRSRRWAWSVHTGVGGKEIVADGAGAVTRHGPVRRLRIETDLVVFSAGVRPRDQLARDCGPAGRRARRHRRRRAVPHRRPRRVRDRRVRAGRRRPGLRAGRAGLRHGPGGGRPLDGQLGGDTGAPTGFTGADLSTKLKLLGVDVASFGDAHGTADGALDVVYSDSRSGVYKKLVIGAAGELLGGVLVGDAEAYGMLRPLTGTVPPLAPEQLVLPAGVAGEGGGALGPSALPDSAVLCNCHNVTKGTVRAAVTEHSCGTLPEIKKCTKAGTGCGSCVKSLTTVVNDELAASGADVDTGLCEHFAAHPRRAVRDRPRPRLNDFAALLDSHGRRRPATATAARSASPRSARSRLPRARLGADGYVLDGEQAALQDTNDHFLANLQRNGSYSVVPRIPGGEITPEKLIVIGEVARDFGLYTKITGGQRIDLFGARVDQLPAVWAPPGGRRLRVRPRVRQGAAHREVLRGADLVPLRRTGLGPLAIELELRYRGLRSPHKLKSAVSGCARECAEARGKDFGIIATSNGWNLYVGGNGGADPRHADLLATGP